MFLHKNKLYMNTQAEICQKFKNKRAKNKHQAEVLIEPTNLRILLNPCKQIEM